MSRLPLTGVLTRLLLTIMDPLTTLPSAMLPGSLTHTVYFRGSSFSVTISGGRDHLIVNEDDDRSTTMIEDDGRAGGTMGKPRILD
jgi:hypothetical protein